MNSIRGISVRGIAAAVPTQIARTSDYPYLEPAERQRLQKATGIAAHRVSRPEQCTSDLCAAAAKHLLERIGWEADSVGALILVTQTPDQPIPATAIVLQDKLGVGKHSIAFDINLGCSAFPYGMATVASLMQSLGINRSLLLMGDITSRVCAFSDKTAWPLFGDAGSAIALEADRDAAPLYFDLMSDGSGRDAIVIPGGGAASRKPAGDGPIVAVPGEDGIARRPDQILLRGADIFSFAISKVPLSIGRALVAAGRSAMDTDFLLLHQANKMINDTVAKKSGFSPEKTLTTLGEYGNTSSTSIPLTLCAHQDSFDEDKVIAACGFGVGLSWGTVVFKLIGARVFQVIESDHVY